MKCPHCQQRLPADDPAACPDCRRELRGELVVVTLPAKHDAVVKARQAGVWSELDARARVTSAAALVKAKALLDGLGFVTTFVGELQADATRRAQSASTPFGTLASLLAPLREAAGGEAVDAWLVKSRAKAKCHPAPTLDAEAAAYVALLKQTWKAVKQQKLEKVLLGEVNGTRRAKAGVGRMAAFSAVQPDDPFAGWWFDLEVANRVVVAAGDDAALKRALAGFDDGFVSETTVLAAGHLVSRAQWARHLANALKWNTLSQAVTQAHFARVLDAKLVSAAMAQATDRERAAESIAALQPRPFDRCAAAITEGQRLFAPHAGKTKPKPEQRRPAWELSIGTAKGPKLAPHAGRCACGTKRPCVAQVRLRDVDASFADRLLRVYWCSECDWREAGADAVAMLSAATKKDVSRRGDGAALTFSAFDDDARGARRTSQFGGFAYSPQPSDLADAMNETGSAFTCSGCRGEVTHALRLGDGDFALGGDAVTVNVYVCVRAKCRKPRLEIDAASH